MREARIILPLADNNGNPVEAAHEYLKGRLCRLYSATIWIGGARRSGW